MKALAIFIYRNDGIPLFSRYYEYKAHIVDELVTPFLVSTSERMEEITGNLVKEINLDEDTYLIMESFGEITCAVLVRQQPKGELPLNLVARRFYKRYHSKILGDNWTGKIETFEEFAPELEAILNLETNTIIKKFPKRPLDVFVLTEYPSAVHHFIKLLIKRRHLSRREIKEMKPQKRILQTLDQLVSKGYIGIQDIDGEESYFISD